MFKYMYTIFLKKVCIQYAVSFYMHSITKSLHPFQYYASGLVQINEAIRRAQFDERQPLKVLEDIEAKITLLLRKNRAIIASFKVRHLRCAIHSFQPIHVRVPRYSPLCRWAIFGNPTSNASSETRTSRRSLSPTFSVANKISRNNATELPPATRPGRTSTRCLKWSRKQASCPT